MSSCFPFNSSNRFISSASTFLSKIGTFFCYKGKSDEEKNNNRQSSTNSESPTDSIDTSPLNNSTASNIEASGLSGAETQAGGISDGGLSYSYSITSISRESSPVSTFSGVSNSTKSSSFSPREISPLKLYEAESSLTPPDLVQGGLRSEQGISRSDAREDSKENQVKIRFTASPKDIQNVKDPEFISTDEKNKNYLVEYIENITEKMKKNNEDPKVVEDSPSTRCRIDKPISNHPNNISFDKWGNCINLTSANLNKGVTVGIGYWDKHTSVKPSAISERIGTENGQRFCNF